MSLRYWVDIKTTSFPVINKDSSVLVFPVGATEQHGPHLPVGVDMQIVDGLINTMEPLLPLEIDVIVLPKCAVGKSNEHTDFAGTLSLSAHTLISVWTEILGGAIRAGFKKILILNGHGGQSGIAQIVARDLRITNNVLAVAIDWWSLTQSMSPFDPEEGQHGIHAGAEETSIMLHLCPGLVDKSSIKNFIPNTLSKANDFPLLYGKRLFGWKAQDIHPEGACGNATLATPEHGCALLKSASKGLSDLLMEMSKFPVDSFI